MAEEEPTRNWVDLPPDITSNILHRLGAIEILENAQNVCTDWYKVCKDPAMWRVIDFSFFVMMRRSGSSIFYHCFSGRNRIRVMNMCKHAVVDRSQGQLVDISIDFAGNVPDVLLRLIDDHWSSQLRHLQLLNCHHPDYYLGIAVTRLPLLEELHLYKTLISGQTIETIGHSCPRLKSFTLDCKGGYTRRDYEASVLAIAETMPGLRSLTLFGRVSNEGLQAILDKLPHLECLDLSQCRFCLKGDLLTRCLRQIKDFSPPSDSKNVYKFYDEW